MQLLTVIAVLALLFSLIADRKKTFEGVKKGLIMLIRILPSILSVLILVSVVLYFLPNEVIVRYLGEEAGFSGYVLAALGGSVALIPGFIAYPLAGLLVRTGVSYPVIAVFITTLMMVGVLTLPVEIRYFGVKASLLRNALYLLAALIIGTLIGVFYLT
jgi:uncharacterized membrane protein YraQ (UPF0718 family)